MKKKIAVHDLKPGMFVAALDRPWRGTPFLFQGFEIRSSDEIVALHDCCKHVYVLAEANHGPAGSRSARKPLVPVSDSSESQTSISADFSILKRFQSDRPQKSRYKDQAILEQEMRRVKEIEREARVAIFSILDDARLGRSVDSGAAKRVVSKIGQSVIRNPDALICLGQLKKKDEYTAMHSLRVCVLALVFGRHLNFSADDLNLLGIGALLHDIGKMRVPNDILNKPAGLTASEFAIMKRHVPYGVAILEKSKGILPGSLEVARFHHERYDGTGYTSGTPGERIGLFGQIGAIVDCYDAITSDRVYHNGMSAHDALRKMYDWRGRDFHHALVEQFIQCMGIYPIGSLVELSTGGVGVVISINRERRLKPRIAMVLTSDKQPYASAKIIDLMHQDGSTPETEVEIKTVLSAGSFGINPIDYLPFGN